LKRSKRDRAALSILSFCSRLSSHRFGIQEAPQAAPKREPAMEAMVSVSPPLLAAIISASSGSNFRKQ
jgi:hypothetical protein